MNSPFVSPNVASARSLTKSVYALQALSCVSAITLLAGMARGVLFGVALAALLGGLAINYWKWDAMRGLWLESHFVWQLLTFWWYVVAATLGVPLLMAIMGFDSLRVSAGVLVLFSLILRRIGKGWLRLRDDQPMD